MAHLNDVIDSDWRRTRAIPFDGQPNSKFPARSFRIAPSIHSIVKKSTELANRRESGDLVSAFTAFPRKYAMEWTPPFKTASSVPEWKVQDQPLRMRGASKMKITTIGIDLAKNVVQDHTRFGSDCGTYFR